MRSLTVHARVGADGTLRLDVPIGPEDAGREVVVTVKPEPEPTEQRPAASWPEGYFESTYGCLADTPIERPDQGEYEVRESLD